MGSPKMDGAAAARTKSQRGVITAVPKELSLGLIDQVYSHPAVVLEVLGTSFAQIERNALVS